MVDSPFQVAGALVSPAMNGLPRECWRTRWFAAAEAVGVRGLAAVRARRAQEQRASTLIAGLGGPPLIEAQSRDVCERTSGRLSMRPRSEVSMLFWPAPSSRPMIDARLGAASSSAMPARSRRPAMPRHHIRDRVTATRLFTIGIPSCRETDSQYRRHSRGATATNFSLIIGKPLSHPCRRSREVHPMFTARTSRCSFCSIRLSVEYLQVLSCWFLLCSVVHGNTEGSITRKRERAKPRKGIEKDGHACPGKARAGHG